MRFAFPERIAYEEKQDENSKKGNDKRSKESALRMFCGLICKFGTFVGHEIAAFI